MSQHSHKTTPFEKREFPLVIICDGVSGPANIGSLFRVADAFGVAELVFCNASNDLDSPRMKKTSRDTHRKVNFSVVEKTSDAIKEYREAGYLIVSLEISNGSKPLSQFAVERNGKLAIVVGNEQHGIADENLELSDSVYHIEMYGENSSINVSHATAIALYHLTEKITAD